MLLRIAIAGTFLCATVLAQVPFADRDAPGREAVLAFIGKDYDAAVALAASRGNSFAIWKCGDDLEVQYRFSAAEEGDAERFPKPRRWRGCVATLVEVSDEDPRLATTDHWNCQWALLLDSGGIVRDVLWDSMFSRCVPGTECWDE